MLLKELQGAPADLDDPLADDMVALKRFRFTEKLMKLTVNKVYVKYFNDSIKFDDDDEEFA